ncbi:MAG: hypothetical protein FJ291_11995 [Planctomycetes bacterium]|nr:hypothetical protein [Planctomycetota bacterium]
MNDAKQFLHHPSIWQAIIPSTFTPRLRRAPFLLWLGADGLPTPLDRFLAVRDWVESRGG